MKLLTRLLPCLYIFVGLLYGWHAYVVYAVGGFFAQNLERIVLVLTSCLVFFSSILSYKNQRASCILSIICSFSFSIDFAIQFLRFKNTNDIPYFLLLILPPSGFAFLLSRKRLSD